MKAKGNLPPQRPLTLPPSRRQTRVLVAHAEKRSWFSLVITGFGGVLLEYWRTVRERVRAVQNRSAAMRPPRTKKGS